VKRETASARRLRFVALLESLTSGQMVKYNAGGTGPAVQKKIAAKAKLYN
jgi:hypothetical protein